MNLSDIAIPCGLFAKSFFNDTFQLYKLNENGKNQITINDTGIAWKSDVEKAFKNIKKD